MKVTDHYSELGKATNDILSRTLSFPKLESFSSNHAFIHDFALWLELLDKRPEIEILKNAIKEYQMSLLSCSLGLYQQAFMGLRFFLERCLVAIMFSANEIELNLWKIGERDTYWAELMDLDRGIFSHKFVRAFFPELKDERSHFHAITAKVYKECSQFVHGNQAVIDKIPTGLVFTEELFEEWNIRADIIKRVILFSLCLRYLRSFDSEQVKKIESILSEEFNGIAPINEIITR